MADSKFLKWQDKDGDGLSDVCNDIIDVEPVHNCPPCVPNPYAMAPDWRAVSSTSAYFNEKTCQYEVAVVTSGSAVTTPAEVVDIYDDYESQAIETLLNEFDKDDSDTNIIAVKGSMTPTEYYLSPERGSRVIAFYTIEYEDFVGLEDAVDDEEDDDEEDEDEDTNAAVTVTYNADELNPKITKIRRGLFLYSKYLNVYRAVDGGNLVFEKSRLLFNLKSYGDAGVFNGSILARAMSDLDEWLNGKGYNIVGFGTAGLFKDKVTKLEFNFNSDYKLIKLLVWTAGCGGEPIPFGVKKLKSLNSTEAFKDPTAMAYLSKADAMETDLTAREAKPWLEFLIEHTHPKIFETFDFPMDQADPEDTEESCVAEALQNEMKQLGQDILDPAFSLGDAIAYAFRKETCKKDIGELRKEDIRLGMQWAPDADPKMNKNIFVMAREQAFQELEEKDQTFKAVCAGLMGGNTNPRGFQGSKKMGSDLLQGIWEDGFAKLKVCGLQGILMEVIGCLAGALSLEEALGKICESALRSMNLTNFGDLFLGLPPDVQGKIEERVKQMLSEGDVFRPGTRNQALSDVASGKIEFYRPFKEEALLARENNEDLSERNSRTLAKTYDGATDEDKYKHAPTIMGMYIQALMFVYISGENDLGLLSLVDLLNKYPGAQLIANLIASMECPGPPKSNPPLPQWYKGEFELPSCRNGFKLSAPKLENPFAWIPDVKDFVKILYQLLKKAIIHAIGLALVKLLSKICSLLGNAMCKAMATVGSAIASLPEAATGQTTFKDIVKEAICGENASDEKTDKAIEELFESLGIGAEAMSDTEAVEQFVSDISNAVTRREMTDAFLGKPSPQMLTIVDTIRRHDFPQFGEGLPNTEAIGNFFGNVGNLFPADFRDDLQNLSDALPEDEVFSANPLLCATPDQLEAFCETRAALLEGRLPDGEAAQQCSDIRDTLAEDLGDIADIIQGGIPQYIGRNIPPLVSDPGCDNGMIPFESEEALAASSEVTKGIFRQLRNAYSRDMLNNGPGSSNWGMINLILSDTMGNPLTAHYRKTTWTRTTVDFYTDVGDEADAGRKAPTMLQKGAFPVKVAEWLQYQFQGSADEAGYSDAATDLASSMSFISNNEFQETQTYGQSFSKLGITEGWGGVYNVSALSFPDQGFGVATTVDLQKEYVVFIKDGRKAAPDLNLDFKDNAKGLRSGPGELKSEYAYGFNVEMYLSDLTNNEQFLTGSLTGSVPGINIFSDNARIRILEHFNNSALYIDPSAADIEEEANPKSTSDSDESVMSVRKYEFLSSDNTLDSFHTVLDQYPDFAQCFVGQQDYLPQVVLLNELTVGDDVDSVKTFYDQFMTHVTHTFRTEIGENTGSFDYGAQYDGLSREDTEYILPEGYRDSGMSYAEAEIEDEETGEYRPITSEDMILGVSKMQYEIENGTYAGLDTENRVFYLDPQQAGGSYMSPSIYIKPRKNKGWMSIVDVMFPELGPCKPQKSDLIDFQAIQDMVDEVYTNLAPDPRMKIEDTQCLIQKPYHRLLERRSAATIEGLIVAACRMYASTHFLKTLATFTTFAPDFENVYSPIYAQYIVEKMEEGFKDAVPDRFEALSTFKDEEFWYAFLEQSVQMYARKCDTGHIEPPQFIQRILTRLNDMQEGYTYPTRQDLQSDKEANLVRKIKTLKNYRQDKNLEAVYSSEELAKLVLKELVNMELQTMSQQFLVNLEALGFEPAYTDLDYYVMQNFTQKSSLDLDKEVAEEIEELPTTPTDDDYYYTSGGEFSVYEVLSETSTHQKGDEYKGYYHVHEEDDGSISYMEGPHHTDVAHDLLKPMASKVITPIGDVASYGDSFSNDIEQPFFIEKYISIDGTKYSPADAQSIILANDPALNLSEVYPGTMEQVVDPSGMVTGVTGDLGVIYGLQFSIIIDGDKYLLTSVEMSALDLPIGQFPPLEGDTKLLYCLIKMLKDAPGFQIMTKYIFPLKNTLSVFAIYNDMAFLSSIGEWTVAFTDTYSSKTSKKPGISIEVEVDEDTGTVTSEMTENVGWSAIGSRIGPWTPFVTTWDEWDKELLNKSRRRLKRLFRWQYNSRDFKPGQFPSLGINGPGQVFMRNLRANMAPRPGEKLLPWWKRRKLKSNPFNADGQMCDKSDE